MLATIQSAAVDGLSAHAITVEVDISSGFPSFTIVGLPDAAIQESKERIRSAIKHFGVSFPDIKVIVNLAPADVRKTGPSYDLPIALAILAAAGHIPISALENVMCFGEVALDGTLRGVHGVLAMTQLAQDASIDVIVPAANAEEAALVPNVSVYAPTTLAEAVQHLSSTTNDNKLLPIRHTPPTASEPDTDYDIAHIRGHEEVKRILEIAAAGMHHVLLYGPPGSGKTLLAKTLISLLPPMSVQEMLDATRLYSVAGNLPRNQSYISERPFRSPHHSASTAALVGGGRVPRPGEISLAHHGVLYLDELPEFNRATIEALRQPLEEHAITVARVDSTITYPAKSVFIGSLNPCPCGYFGDEEKECVCTPRSIALYQKKLSGPLLDRIDLFCYVPRITFDALTSDAHSEDSKTVRNRVAAAHARQSTIYNAHIEGRNIEDVCKTTPDAKQLLRRAVAAMKLSPRGYHRVLRVAKTIADLAESDVIETQHVSEALQYRKNGL